MRFLKTLLRVLTKGLSTREFHEVLKRWADKNHVPPGVLVTVGKRLDWKEPACIDVSPLASFLGWEHFHRIRA